MREFLNSQKFRWIAIAILSLALLLLSFQLGIYVGFRKANFFLARHSNLGQTNFEFGHRGFGKKFFSQDVDGAHGAFGEIVKIETNKISIKNRMGQEIIIQTDANTKFKKSNNSAVLTDLKVGDRIFVIGKPDTDGNISAIFIKTLENNY